MELIVASLIGLLLFAAWFFYEVMSRANEWVEDVINWKREEHEQTH